MNYKGAEMYSKKIVGEINSKILSKNEKMKQRDISIDILNFLQFCLSPIHIWSLYMENIVSWLQVVPLVMFCSFLFWLYLVFRSGAKI